MENKVVRGRQDWELRTSVKVWGNIPWSAKDDIKQIGNGVEWGKGKVGHDLESVPRS